MRLFTFEPPVPRENYATTLKNSVITGFRMSENDITLEFKGGGRLELWGEYEAEDGEVYTYINTSLKGNIQKESSTNFSDYLQDKHKGGTDEKETE